MSRPPWSKKSGEEKLLDNWLQELVYASESGHVENLNAVSEEIRRLFRETLDYARTRK